MADAQASGACYGNIVCICSQEWRNGRRAGFRCLLWQHSVGSSPISCILINFLRIIHAEVSELADEQD